MEKFFDSNNPVMRFLSRLVDLAIVNILTVFTSVLLITAGGAITAMNHVLLHLVREDETYITKMFWTSFKANFKQGTAIWLIYIAYVGVGIADFCALRVLGVPDASLLGSLSKLFFLPAILTLPWVFAFLSRFENTVKGTLKFVGYLTLRHFGRTLLLVALLGGCAVVVWLLPILVWLLPAVCCLAMSYLIEPVFKAQTENKEDGNDDPWYNE